MDAGSTPGKRDWEKECRADLATANRGGGVCLISGFLLAVVLMGLWVVSKEGHVLAWALVAVLSLVVFIAPMVQATNLEYAIVHLKKHLKEQEGELRALQEEHKNALEFYGQFAPPITVVQDTLRDRAFRVREAHERYEHLLRRGMEGYNLGPDAVLEVAFLSRLGDFKNQKKVAKAAFMRLAKLAQGRSYAVESSWRGYVGMERKPNVSKS